MKLVDRINKVLNDPNVTELVKGTIRLALAEGNEAHAMSMVVRIEQLEMIPETVTLLFNPEAASKEVQEVFANELARTLWLAIKPGHLTSGSFNEDCLRRAKIINGIKKKKESLNAQGFLMILSGLAAGPGHMILGATELDFATELLPFVNGDKKISFKVKAS